MLLEPLRYMEIKVLSGAYADGFGLIFSLLFFAIMFVIVLSTYLILNQHELPLILMVGIDAGDIGCVVLGHFVFELVTKPHLVSRELLDVAQNTGGQHHSTSGNFGKE